jgi:peptide-methionine (S)-S-oxide reductase
MEKATFAAGCFWGVEDAFRHVDGVVDTRVGYAGGDTENPTYEAVCRNDTGHAEAVEITYDPEIISYEELLEILWGIHDPTQVNRQGPDVGAQYRSVVFVHDAEQEAAARRSIEMLDSSGRFERPIATEIVPASEFYRAEDYHQQYYEKRFG